MQTLAIKRALWLISCAFGDSPAIVFAASAKATARQARSRSTPLTHPAQRWNVLSSVKERGSHGALRSTRWLTDAASPPNDPFGESF